MCITCVSGWYDGFARRGATMMHRLPCVLRICYIWWHSGHLSIYIYIYIYATPPPHPAHHHCARASVFIEWNLFSSVCPKRHRTAYHITCAHKHRVHAFTIYTYIYIHGINEDPAATHIGARVQNDGFDRPYCNVFLYSSPPEFLVRPAHMGCVVCVWQTIGCVAFDKTGLIGSRTAHEVGCRRRWRTIKCCLCNGEIMSETIHVCLDGDSRVIYICALV